MISWRTAQAKKADTLAKWRARSRPRVPAQPGCGSGRADPRRRSAAHPRLRHLIDKGAQIGPVVGEGVPRCPTRFAVPQEVLDQSLQPRPCSSSAPGDKAQSSGPTISTQGGDSSVGTGGRIRSDHGSSSPTLPVFHITVKFTPGRPASSQRVPRGRTGNPAPQHCI
jgi:hypothetical protein